jgi:hypothetical protein
MMIEAALLLAAARLALRVLPFRRLVWLFDRPAADRAVTGAQRERLRMEVGRSIWLAAGRLPGPVVCFPRAIAAHLMLRRRGVATTLYYGAARRPEGGPPLTHVWVQDGAQGVVGARRARDCVVLGSYPSVLGNGLAGGRALA